MIRENSFSVRIISSLLPIVFYLGIIWGECAGIYHAFKHHGISDGFVAVIIPPYSWYRSIDFIFWMKRGDLTKAEKEELDHFLESMALNRKAFNMLDEALSKQGFLATVDEEIDNEMVNLLRKSVSFQKNLDSL